LCGWLPLQRQLPLKSGPSSRGATIRSVELFRVMY